MSSVGWRGMRVITSTFRIIFAWLSVVCRTQSSAALIKDLIGLKWPALGTISYFQNPVLAQIQSQKLLLLLNL